MKPLTSVWMSRLGEAGMWLMAMHAVIGARFLVLLVGWKGTLCISGCDSMLSLRKGPVGT